MALAVYQMTQQNPVLENGKFRKFNAESKENRNSKTYISSERVMQQLNGKRKLS